MHRPLPQVRLVESSVCHAPTTHTLCLCTLSSSYLHLFVCLLHYMKAVIFLRPQSFAGQVQSPSPPMSHLVSAIGVRSSFADALHLLHFCTFHAPSGSQQDVTISTANPSKHKYACTRYSNGMFRSRELWRDDVALVRLDCVREDISSYLHH